jgi:hypothetical protein
MFVDLTSVLSPKQGEDPGRLREKYAAEAERYRDEQKELDAEAKKLEAETQQERRRADRYDLGEVFLEIALVISSITLLSGRRAFWYAGIVMGLIGSAVAVTGIFLH